MRNEDLYTLIQYPLVSEKSVNSESIGQYTFSVQPRASKNNIKKAIEFIFEVNVLKVRTLNVAGKTRRTRFGLGKQKNWKKAVVTVAEGATD